MTYFETLKIENGEILNLFYHNLRLNKTIHDIHGRKSNFDLKKFINIPNYKTYRCKVIYSKEIEKIEFMPLKKRVFKSFKFLESDVEYPYKNTNRDKLNYLFDKRDKCDDIIIVKDGLITDSTIANIAIYDGLKWYTPKKPLLHGTQRAKLLKDKSIIEKDIKLKDMKNIVDFAIMNSLIGFYKIQNVRFEY